MSNSTSHDPVTHRDPPRLFSCTSPLLAQCMLHPISTAVWLHKAFVYVLSSFIFHFLSNQNSARQRQPECQCPLPPSCACTCHSPATSTIQGMLPHWPRHAQLPLVHYHMAPTWSPLQQCNCLSRQWLLWQPIPWQSDYGVTTTTTTVRWRLQQRCNQDDCNNNGVVKKINDDYDNNNRTGTPTRQQSSRRWWGLAMAVLAATEMQQLWVRRWQKQYYRPV